MSEGPAAAASPPAVDVPHNRWDLLDVPEIGAWTPTRRVSVILPYYMAPDALALTLAALAEQTYPRELLEIIVADDGSDPPAIVPDGFEGLDIRVVHQEDRGFGLARARNTGAKAAAGDILIFIDCDMVPEPQHIEAHARWHHVAGDAVTLGFRRHVDYGPVDDLPAITAADVRAAAADGELAPLFEGRDVQVPEWIEGHMRRTGELTSGDDDLFRMVTGGNLGMRAETYWRAGGSDESFTQWGAEDTELGYRLFVDGVLLVPERQARCWHQGHGHTPEAHELESLEEQRAKLAHLIAHRGFRSGGHGRVFARPRVAARIDAGDMRRQVLSPTIEAVLAGSFHDLRVLLAVPADHPDRVWLERQFGPDPRVEVGDDVAVPEHTPVVMDLPPDVRLPGEVVGSLVGMLESADDPVGTVHLTIPGSAPTERAIHMRTTRAWQRARRVAGAGADNETIGTVAARLFDERWLSGARLGVTVGGVAPSPQIRDATDDALSSDQVLPPAQVPHNRWDLLDVPDLGGWTPTHKVSVILPHYQAPEALQVTLAALAEQTYPSDLLEVIVADDGSTPTPTIPSELAADLDVKVVTQERRGFGAGRARNTGAHAAAGDILIFLDCDMVPEAQHVEAHARWHHVAADLVTLGFRKHADFDHLTAADVRAAVAQRDLAGRFEGRPVEVPEWIEGHMARTSELRSADDDLFRVVTSGNLGLRAETYWRAGGFDESFTQWGGEDTELGYRLFIDGDVLVPERAAMCWHQGYGHEPDASELASLEDQRARLAHLIAHRGFRRRTGRIYQRPRVAVMIDAAGQARAALAACIDSVLSSDLHDVQVLLTLPADHPDHRWLHRQYDPDPRVGMAEHHEPPRHSPIQVQLVAAAMLETEALDRIVSLLEATDQPVGAVHATVAGEEPGDAMLHARRTRAVQRAARVARVTGEPADEVLGRLFGERWVSGAQLGVRAEGVEIGDDVPRLGQGAASGVTGDEMQSAFALFSSLDPGARQQVLGLARTVFTSTTPGQRNLLITIVKRLLGLLGALGQLAGARDKRSAVRGVTAVAKAVLPWSVYTKVRALARRTIRPLLGGDGR